MVEQKVSVAKGHRENLGCPGAHRREKVREDPGKQSREEQLESVAKQRGKRANE